MARRKTPDAAASAWSCNAMAVSREVPPPSARMLAFGYGKRGDGARHQWRMEGRTGDNAPKAGLTGCMIVAWRARRHHHHNIQKTFVVIFSARLASRSFPFVCFAEEWASSGENGDGVLELQEVKFCAFNSSPGLLDGILLVEMRRGLAGVARSVDFQ